MNETPPDTSRTAATLTGAKRIADGLQSATRILGITPDFTACGGPAAEAYWNYFTPARISSLLAALEAVLKLHQPIYYARVPGERSSRRCSTCAGPPRWPCPEVRAITTALGEEAGDGG